MREIGDRERFLPTAWLQGLQSDFGRLHRVNRHIYQLGELQTNYAVTPESPAPSLRLQQVADGVEPVVDSQ